MIAVLITHDHSDHANEATTFTINHDVRIGGHALPAGSYTFFVFPGESEWTLVFNRVPRQWGAFDYNPAFDALRVAAKPVECAREEFLRYDIAPRGTNAAVVALSWEKKRVAFRVEAGRTVTLGRPVRSTDCRHPSPVTCSGISISFDQLIEGGRMKSSRPVLATGILTLSILAAGCAGKMTSENYAKVTNGMTPAQVEVILGPGTEQASSGVAVPAMPAMPPGVPTPAAGTGGIGAPGTTVTTKVLVWQKGGKMITATFMNDQLVAKTQVGL